MLGRTVGKLRFHADEQVAARAGVLVDAWRAALDADDMRTGGTSAQAPFEGDA